MTEEQANCPYCAHKNGSYNKDLAQGRYESCNLGVNEGCWMIQVWGDSEGSQPVNYCPMCGRNLRGDSYVRD